MDGPWIRRPRYMLSRKLPPGWSHGQVGVNTSHPFCENCIGCRFSAGSSDEPDTSRHSTAVCQCRCRTCFFHIRKLRIAVLANAMALVKIKGKHDRKIVRQAWQHLLLMTQRHCITCNKTRKKLENTQRITLMGRMAPVSGSLGSEWRTFAWISRQHRRPGFESPVIKKTVRRTSRDLLVTQLAAKQRKRNELKL